MTVKITKPALNLREELASLRNQGSAYEESKFYLDNLVTNGDFSNGTTGWTANGNANLSINSGALRLTTATGGQPCYATTPLTLEVGKTYQYSIDNITTQGSGGMYMYLGSAAGSGSNVNVNIQSQAGTTTGTFVATHATTILTLLSGSSNQTGEYKEFDNISVHETAPNLVTNGTFDSDSDWTKGTGWTISGGKAVATSLGSGVGITQSITVPTTGIYTVTADITKTASNYRLSVGTIFGPSASGATGKISLTGLLTAGSHTVTMAGWSTGFSGTIDNIIVTQGNHHAIHSTPYGYEIKDVYIDGDLAREGEAYDYTVHDGFIQPTIEPTASTETVVIGVRK